MGDLKIINKTERMTRALNRMFSVEEKLAGRFKKVINQNKKIKIKKQEFKDVLKFEKTLINIHVQNVADFTGTEISFDGEYIVFTKKGEK